MSNAAKVLRLSKLAPLEPYTPCVVRRRGWAPRVPKEPFSPISFSARRDERRAAGVWVARTLGPLRAGLKDEPAVNDKARGDHETR